MTATRLNLAVLFFLLLAPLPALAHKVTVFAWVEGEKVYTQSKFSGGKKVNAGRIEVFDQNDRKILEGATDDQGQFSFSRPKDATALKVVLTAGMGHTNFWMISDKEFSGGTLTPQSSSPAVQAPHTDEIHVNADAIEAIVARVVERELAPVKAQLAKEAWGLRDIVAGVGYIIGLMGLASYISYRKKEK